MNFKIVVLVALICVVFVESNESSREGRFINYKKKNYAEYKKLEKSDLEETKRSEEYAGEALNGMYTDCFVQLSFSCIQKKVLNFINRMNRMEKFAVLGDYVNVMRTKDVYEQESQFQARLNNAEQQQSGLDDLMETAIDRFLNSHIFRVKVPNSFSVIKPAESRGFESTTSLDFRFPYSDATEGRGKKGGGKMGKKMMMMMMMGMKAKMLMMLPLMMGMAGLIAMKALIASVISITISKIMILKKLLKNKGGGGGGHGGGWESSGGGGGGGGGWQVVGGGGGGGGWDRRSIDEGKSWDASDLAYRAYSTVENLF